MASAPRLRSVCIKLLSVIFVGASQMNKGNLTLEIFTPCKSDIVLIKAESCSLSSLNWLLAAGKCHCVGASLHQQFCSDFCQIAKHLIDVVAVKFSSFSPISCL